MKSDDSIRNEHRRPLLGLGPGLLRGVLWLLPLLAILSALLWWITRPRLSREFTEALNTENLHTSTSVRAENNSAQTDILAEKLEIDELFTFDPNTVTIQELCRLGFSARTAAGIIKYRESGKRFEIPEDFATCYGVSMQHYTLLEPFILIGEQYRLNAKAKETRKTVDVGSASQKHEGLPAESFDPNELDTEGFYSLGFSLRQAEAIVKFRESIGGFRSSDDLKRCYVVSESMFEKIAPFIAITDRPNYKPEESATELPIELNGADSAALRSVSGIGEVLVVRILDYRDRLGGFARSEQLAEIQGMNQINYERIITQIWIDSCRIKKIDVNFASHKNLVDVLEAHPYADRKFIRKLLKERQLKGGWSNIRELVEQNILSEKEAARLSPYLLFRSEQ